jgi:beta-mannosidase
VRAAASGNGAERVEIHLLGRDGAIRSGEVGPAELVDGLFWDDLPVSLWWPNGSGEQPLYTVRIEVLGPAGRVDDSAELQVGFCDVTWQSCEGAPEEADPWICVVNGRPIFLQGFNWTPIRPNFADVSDDDYRRLLETYRDMGVNMLRVWGGAYLEKEIFYRLCDELGILVWQEFPLSSSGLDNSPPDDREAVAEMEQIARSYIERRRHHISLVIWCGGNELQDESYRPLNLSHPMLGRLAEVVAEMDPQRRFLPTSPSGPRFGADRERFGAGEHWDVHGPWHVQGSLDGEYQDYWNGNDALFHSEIGAAGASPVEIIRRYKGPLPETPGTKENPLWRRTSWWVEWPIFVEETSREPRDLEEYVAWSQERQRRALSIAARSAKGRFPRCGGFLVWMGHDSYPCTANTSVIDFDGRLKPAGEELARIYGPGTAQVEDRHA